MLLAALPALLLPVKLLFELFDPGFVLFDKPCAVSPLSAVFEFVCFEEDGGSRFDRC